MAIKSQAIGIIIDCSGSMSWLNKEVNRDFADLVSAIKTSSAKTGIDTRVTVLESSAGMKAMNTIQDLNVDIHQLYTQRRLPSDGNGTRINDAIVQLIELFRALYKDNREVLIYVLTDGQDTCSNSTNYETQKLILDNKNWVVSFRGPKSVRDIYNRIDHENFLIWGTRDELVQSSAATVQATTQYFDDRSKGVMRSTLYSNLNATSSQVKAHMQEITDDVQVAAVSYDCVIKSFVENKIGEELLKGAAFYQLTKTERNVQSYKQVLIRDKKTGKIYAGDWARQALGLPLNQDVTLKPGMHGHYDIFVQSTSTNRKLVGGTDLIYWRSVGEPFTTQNSKAVQFKAVDPLDQVYDGLTGYEWYRRGVEAGRKRITASHCGNKYAVAFFNEGYEDGRKRQKLRYKR